MKHGQGSRVDCALQDLVTPALSYSICTVCVFHLPHATRLPECTLVCMHPHPWGCRWVRCCQAHEQHSTHLQVQGCEVAVVCASLAVCVWQFDWRPQKLGVFVFVLLPGGVVCWEHRVDCCSAYHTTLACSATVGPDTGQHRSHCKLKLVCEHAWAEGLKRAVRLGV